MSKNVYYLLFALLFITLAGSLLWSIAWGFDANTPHAAESATLKSYADNIAALSFAALIFLSMYYHRKNKRKELR